MAKASVLLGRIQEQTSHSPGTDTASVLVDTAYAKSAHGGGHGGGKAQAPAVPESISSAVKRSEPLKLKPQEGSNNIVGDMTKAEMDLLKELSKRRQKLEEENKDLAVREQLLNATENKIDQKVSELKDLKTKLEDLMKQYNQKENGKILSLVKIYENMKPKDAAKIFDELEMPVLLKVAGNMKEIKVAPIIAGMNPVKARELSIELAKQKPLE
jgi:flagellar motility protein MotE (MotC chaperone)